MVIETSIEALKTKDLSSDDSIRLPSVVHIIFPTHHNPTIDVVVVRNDLESDLYFLFLDFVDPGTCLYLHSIFSDNAKFEGEDCAVWTT